MNRGMIPTLSYGAAQPSILAQATLANDRPPTLREVSDKVGEHQAQIEFWENVHGPLWNHHRQKVDPDLRRRRIEHHRWAIDLWTR